jgi:hypothetical protein
VIRAVIQSNAKISRLVLQLMLAHPVKLSLKALCFAAENQLL